MLWSIGAGPMALWLALWEGVGGVSKQGPGDRSGDQWGCLVVPGRRRLQGAVVDRELRKEMGKETLGDDSEGFGKFNDVPWNAGRALYIKQVGIALQGNSRHTAPGGRYVTSWAPTWHGVGGLSPPMLLASIPTTYPTLPTSPREPP